MDEDPQPLGISQIKLGGGVLFVVAPTAHQGKVGIAGFGWRLFTKMILARARELKGSRNSIGHGCPFSEWDKNCHEASLGALDDGDTFPGRKKPHPTIFAE
jgi:hypothetical protein